jgi:tetratricopeptide (TPR) repeat protein
LRQLQARGPASGLDQALLDLAWNQQMKNKLDQSGELLRELLDKYPESRLASQAMLRLADIYALKGETAKQREWLKRSADAKQDGLFATSAEAHRRLAVSHEEHKEWKEALTRWQAYRPSSTCGTCLANMRATRAEHIAFCQCHLGDHAAAARVLWETLTQDGLGWSGHLATPLLTLYQQAGQTDDLLRAVDAFEQARLRQWENRPAAERPSREQVLQWLPTSVLRDPARLKEAMRNRKAIDGPVPPAAKPGSLPKDLFKVSP